MKRFNSNVVELEEKNIFLNVIQEIHSYQKKYPEKYLVSLGIGDVTLPIIEPVVKAMHQAVEDLSKEETFQGYHSSFGYDSLKEKILENEYSNFSFTKEEIYISNGTKTDCTNVLELFDIDSKICMTNAMYPIYRDGAYCLNRKVFFLEASEENDFKGSIPEEEYDIIYICSPSNPVGTCYTKEELQKWVDYAIKHDSIILYDNVYMPFIESEDVPKSIYEIEGAKKVAIEFRSFSKTASFTGVRCSYYIIPNDMDPNINRYWRKRTITRFNGTSYIAQKGAEAIYLEESQKLIQRNIQQYKENTKKLREFFLNHQFKVYGGVDSPYLWIQIKEDMSSWEYFEFCLDKLGIIIIPGIVFGENGDHYFRVSGLGHQKEIEEAIVRLEEYYEKENI